MVGIEESGEAVDFQGEQDWRRNGQHTTCKRGGSISYKPKEEIHDTNMPHHIALCTGCPSGASSLMSHKDTLKGVEGTEGILGWWRSMCFRSRKIDLSSIVYAACCMAHVEYSIEAGLTPRQSTSIKKLKISSGSTRIKKGSVQCLRD
jgi:hypothetical protein